MSLPDPQKGLGGGILERGLFAKQPSKCRRSEPRDRGQDRWATLGL